MNIDPRYIEALRLLQRKSGEPVYNEVEARFVYLAATYSGYFSQRQYLTFKNQTKWSKSTSLVLKVMDKGHARLKRYRGRGFVYHLFSTMVYEAIGQSDSTNRYIHQYEYQQARLASLDYVIAHQDAEYLETEQRKLSFFCHEMHLQIDSLPQKAIYGLHQSGTAKRYFLDQFPICLARPDGSSAPLVTFTYMDAGHAGFRQYLKHLADYKPLFKQLDKFRLVFASAEPCRFETASRHFTQMVLNRETTREGPTDLMRYFQLRVAREAQDYAKLSMEDIHFYAEAERTYSTERYQVLYGKWRQGEASEAEITESSQQQSKPIQGQFETYTLPSNRYLFSSEPRPKKKVAGEHPIALQLTEDAVQEGN